MHKAGGLDTAARLAARSGPTNNSARIIDFDRFTRSHRSGVMAGKVPIVRDTAVIDETLSAREIIPTTVETD
jgi:hypothetical protein